MSKIDSLFHYCSSEAFLSIVSNKCIWLSSLSLSNDSQEGLLVKNIIDSLLQAESANFKAKNEVAKNLNFIENELDGFALCLSENGDVLSQWRGYADDGHGFSIGFSKDYIKDIISDDSNLFGCSLQKVLYSQKEHEETIRPYYELMKPHFNALSPQGLLGISSDPENAQEKIFTTTLELLNKIYKIKNTGFSEEKEWRILALMLKSKLGGNAEVKFRSRNGKIIPYIELQTPKKDKNVINKIYIGPKNKTPEYVIKACLEHAGLENVEICRSSTSYR